MANVLNQHRSFRSSVSAVLSVDRGTVAKYHTATVSRIVVRLNSNSPCGHAAACAIVLPTIAGS